MFQRDHRSNRDESITQELIMNQINELYEERRQMTNMSGAIYQSNVNRNILLIGRTRTGKTTLKNVLSNPCYIPDELTLISQTASTTCDRRFPIPDSDISLTIVDTPGLFDRRSGSFNPRNEFSNNNDRHRLWEINKYCYQMKITAFHLVFFCVSFEAGINNQDIEALRQIIAHFGQEICSRLCLIITRCESKDDRQRTRLQRELAEDIHFKDVVRLFGQGIYFSGALSRDAYNKKDLEVLATQFETIYDYREKLIGLIRSAHNTFSIKVPEPEPSPTPIPPKENNDNRRVHENKLNCCELL